MELVPLIYGIILVVVVMVLPGGLISLPTRIMEYGQGGPSNPLKLDKIPILSALIRQKNKQE
jgi:hypothetical protein